MKIDASVKVKVRALLKKLPKSLAHQMGVKYTQLSKDKVAAIMPVDNRTRQPFGLLHGGASVALAESLASLGAWLNVDESKFATFGIVINANHFRTM